MNNNAKDPLRVGVLLDSLDVRIWTHEMLETLLNSEYAKVEVLILNTTPNPPKQVVEESKLENLAGRIANKVANTLVTKFIDRDRSTPAANTIVNLNTLFPGTPVLEVATIKKQFSDYFPVESIDAVKGYELDVMLRMGFRILRGGILTSAKHGIWSFHHGDNRVNRGGPPCYWETMQGWSEVGSVLQILDEELDNGKILFRSFSPVYANSPSKTRNRLYWKTQSFMPRTLERLHADEEKFYKHIEKLQDDSIFYSSRLYQDPSPWEHLSLALQRTVSRARSLLHHKRKLDQWILLYSFASPASKTGLSTSMWRYKKMIPSKDKFWADPHVIERAGKYYIYIEEYLYATEKGHISLIEMDEKGNYSEPVTILEKPYHLSYPFVFEADGELWMIPESGANETIDLYKCTSFPAGWEFQHSLMEGVSAVDSTLYFKDGQWWMFANLASHSNVPKWDELYLFYAEDFRSKTWTSHPMNPIVSDVKAARPAGKLYERNSRLYRPSQNCGSCYGYGFNVSEIIVLDKENYKEQVVDRVAPDWDKRLIATHTYNQAGSLSVSDAMLVRNWR